MSNLSAVIKITALREFTNKTKTQERYCISSLATHKDFNSCIRSHRQVKNNLHWVLDMTFREDEQRRRAGILPIILPLSGK
jgi:predicted transposase YbfD/YdcC